MAVSARKLLSDDRFQEWGKTVRPEIWQDYEVKQEYWSEKYSPLLGGMQDFAYNLFLKGNRVSEGKKNYGRVVELLIAASYNREKGELIRACEVEPDVRGYLPAFAGVVWDGV